MPKTKPDDGPDDGQGGSAADRWAAKLSVWKIPEEILEQAPTSPWTHDVSRFVQRADTAATHHSPATALAMNALTEEADAAGTGRGSVLDVGCGAGAASAPLLPIVTRVTGVDENPKMLHAFLDRMARLVVPVRAIEGRWPDVADSADVADVVVCHDVLHNVPDATPFLVRLTDHARRRVVVVAPDSHPQEWTNPYWEQLHGLSRPTGPTADDLAAVLRELGHEVEQVPYTEDTWWAQANQHEVVNSIMRRLCLSPDRESDVKAAVERIGAPTTRTAVALSWQGTAEVRHPR